MFGILSRNKNATTKQKGPNQQGQQRTYFARAKDGRIKLFRNGVESNMRIDSAGGQEAIEEMKQCMYEFEGKPRAWDTLSAERRAAGFDALTRDFARSRHGVDLVRFLETEVLTATGMRIRSCVVAGLGSFNASPRARQQLVAFETILEVLRRRFEVEDIVVQDPAMDEFDVAFLRGRGYTVVEHPDAQNAMTVETF
ncbi:MAG: hypothetical protein L6R39_005220, partial [Caloplaca ligustica]